MPGGDNPNVVKRAAQLGLTGFEYRGTRVAFRDLFGEQGHPVRATVSEMGPLLFARILDLNDVQAGVPIGAMVKSAAHAIGSQLGRQIIRGVPGSILGGRR